MPIGIKTAKCICLVNVGDTAIINHDIISNGIFIASNRMIKNTSYFYHPITIYNCVVHDRAAVEIITYFKRATSFATACTAGIKPVSFNIVMMNSVMRPIRHHKICSDVCHATRITHTFHIGTSVVPDVKITSGR